MLRRASNAPNPYSASQSVYRLYPKAFQVKYYGVQVVEHNFGRSSLFAVVLKLWFVAALCSNSQLFYSHLVVLRLVADSHALPRQSIKEQHANAVRCCLDADFLKMLEAKDELSGIVGPP